jgi:hypothetical protein
MSLKSRFFCGAQIEKIRFARQDKMWKVASLLQWYSASNAIASAKHRGRFKEWAPDARGDQSRVRVGGLGTARKKDCSSVRHSIKLVAEFEHGGFEAESISGTNCL